MTTVALPRQPHSAWIDRLRTIQLGLGARGAVGVGLARQRAAATVPAVDWSQWFTYFWLFKGASSQATSYVDLITDLTMTVANSPAWSFESGLTFNGSNQYADTKFAPTPNMTLMLQFANAATGTGGETSLVGHYKSGGVRVSIGKLVNTNSVLYAAGGVGAIAPMLASGNLAIAHTKTYRNGVAESLTLSGVGSGATQTLLLGARRREDTSSIDLYSALTAVALGIRTTQLNNTQIAEACAAMAAL